MPEKAIRKLQQSRFSAKERKIIIVFCFFHLRNARAVSYNMSVMDNFALLLREVRGSLSRCKIDGRVLVGLSGGADSVALLRALSALRDESGPTLSAVYVNHGLRAAAAEEEDFCAGLCARLRVPFLIKRVRVPALGSLEAAARGVRYEAFQQAMAETGAGTLALAHHMDDQAETVLLHLMYGAGADGLSGMREYSGPVWRPLLGLERGTLREALKELGQDWREDESNGDLSLTRNAIRAQVIPAMRRVFPQAVHAVCRAADIQRAESDCLAQETEAWLSRYAAKGEWPFLLIAPFTDLHSALQRRVLRGYAARLGITLDYQQTDLARDILRRPPGSIDNLPGRWRVMRTKERIHFLPPEPLKHTLAADALRTASCDGAKCGDGRRSQVFPAALWRDAELRFRRGGDWIMPFGMQGRMKLKDYLIARGVDQPFRDGWPLLCREDEVLWVIGVGASERLRTDTAHDEAVFVDYSGPLPDES